MNYNILNLVLIFAMFKIKNYSQQGMFTDRLTIAFLTMHFQGY